MLARRQLVVRLLHQTQKGAATTAARRTFYSARRPTVNGQAVAFHVKDLVNHSPHKSLYKPSRPLVHDAAAVVVDCEEAPAFDSDLIVVLDMDECLIHSQFLTNNPAAKFYAHQVARNSSSSKDGDDDAPSRVDSFQFHLPDGDLVQVNKRPFLEDFLQAVCSQYETHIYTAAMKVYAEPILDRLDPHGDRFAQRWYRESCDLDKNMGAYVKNLGRLPLNREPKNLTYENYLQRSQTPQDNHLRRVVLVDNNPLSFLANPTNGILVSSFYNDPSDKTLPAVLELLKELDPLEDVRPTLDQRFGLKAALSEIQGSRRQQQQLPPQPAPPQQQQQQWTAAAASS